MRLPILLSVLAALALTAPASAGFAKLAGSNVVEQAPSGSSYDLVAHVANVPTYGYNPEWSADTAALGFRLAKQYCRRPQVVGQRVINHEIYGLTSEKPDYMVFIRCAGRSSR